MKEQLLGGWINSDSWAGKKDPSLQCSGIITRGRTRWDQERNTFVSEYPISSQPRDDDGLHEYMNFYEDTKAKGKEDENIR